MADRVDALIAELDTLKVPAKAEFFPKFFKNGKGEYDEGDVFIGVTVPNQRLVAKKYSDLSADELHILLESQVHEHRLTALFILVKQMERAKGELEESFAQFYLQHKDRVNNWDLVDSSAQVMLGKYLLKRDRSLLYELAHSKDLWDKRKAIIATQYFIRKGEFEDTLKISEILLQDHHDLIHKAVGWMLREVGNKKIELEEAFLQKHYKNMPRTMLRYAIEKFPEARRQAYLTGTI
jgi:3-methyladenine DNA glycosylase AlkD